jgi:hypothetical protein
MALECVFGLVKMRFGIFKAKLDQNRIIFQNLRG